MDNNDDFLWKCALNGHDKGNINFLVPNREDDPRNFLNHRRNVEEIATFSYPSGNTESDEVNVFIKEKLDDG